MQLADWGFLLLIGGLLLSITAFQFGKRMPLILTCILVVIGPLAALIGLIFLLIFFL